MNRKALLILVLLSFACFGVANAQTLFSEDFEDISIPAGWTQEGSGTWTFQIGDHNNGVNGAGHGTYNALCDHTSRNNVTKLITPTIDLSSVSSAELSFMHVQRAWGSDIDVLKVYYRTSTSGTWIQLAEYTSAFATWTLEDGIVLPNLSSTYQLAFECTDNYGYGVGVDYVNIVQGASCPKPASLTAVANGQSAILNWTSDATSFDIAWSLNPNADPDQYIETTGHNATNFTRNDLTIDADYYFWVRANCGADGISTWAGPVSVHIGYCAPAPSSVDNNGISHVTFGTGNNVVDNETPTATYADYHDLIGEVEAGIEATVAITYKTSYTYNTYIWVDLDNDLSFERSEIVCQGESTNANPTTLTLSFTIPATQTPGNYRMRIGGADSGMSSADNANPCYTGSYACFQDYTLHVVEGDPLIFVTNITSTEDWNEFCRAVNNGLDYSNQTVTLANDISVTTTAGTQNHPFTGTFDGQGNTLTVNIASIGSQGNAPFHYISNATIQNLVVEGTVYAGSGDNNRHAAGLVGYAWSGTNTLEQCLVKTNVNSGCDYAGGIIGHGKTSNIVMTGCVYTGTITATGTNPVGGLIGWSDNLTGLTLTDCLFNGSYSNSNGSRKFHPIGCTGHADEITATRTITRCHYTLDHSNLNGTTQTLVYNLSDWGKHVYSIVGDSGISVDIDGNASTTYSYSQLAFYDVGLTSSNVVYAASGDQVSLTLDGSSDGYSAMPGTLTGDSNPYTLNMAADNTLIMAGTIDYITEINTTEDWNRFCQLINELGHTYSGDTVTLTDDITISKMAGTSKAISFQGTFDGQGHTLTLSGGDFGTSSSAQSNADCAPFRFVSGATFLNLEVSGDIYSSNQKAAGFIGTAGHGDLTFTNCVSSVNIHASRSNADGTHGSFIGNLQGYNNQEMTATFNGCAFTGSITTTNGTNNVGGFVGWCEWREDNNTSEARGRCHVSLNNCLVAPNASGITSGSKTFARCRNESNSLSINNSYYLQTIGDAQGKKAYSITGDEGITVDFYGEPTNIYSVSGLSFYNAGFKYNNVLYAGSGDTVSLNLEGSSSGYTAVPGGLTGDSNPYTLTMASNNTLIINGSIDYITEIYSSEDWIIFCQAINGLGHDYSGDTVTLMTDITISTMAGSDDTPFRGTFDGGGNTMTLEIGSTSNYLDQRCAPFYRIGNATIKNLITDGNIYSSQQNSAGLVCRVETGTTNYITNCINSVSIHSNRSGDGTNGGFVALINSNNCTVNFEGCAFVGELIGSSTTNWGGFVGWRDYQSGNYNYVNFTNCLFAPRTVSISTSSSTNSRTFCRSRENTTNGATYTNCYYTATVQANDGGRPAYTITGTEGITVAMAGTANSTYDVSGLNFYSPGLTLTNDGTTTLYAASGDNVSLNLNGSSTGYSAVPGELTGDDNPYTLAMESSNTIITAHLNYITEIYNIDDWYTFCLAVNSGHNYSGETVYLMENITDSITSGTTSAFKGTFDGQGHTITINLTSTDPRCAPFNTVTGTSEQNPVTIKNLKVTGIIRTSHIQTAGFIGYVNSYCTITNCISDVTIVSSYNGHGCRAAGFIGQTDSQAHVTFTGCAFTGKLLGASASGCAGFVGFNYSHYSAWAQSGSATVSFTDCVFAPAEVTMEIGSGNAMNVKSATFARSFGSGSSATDGSEGLTFNNCYFTQSFGTVQGKKAYSITSFDTNINPVTVELYGEHTYYDVSDIDGYATGIVYNGTIYAGNGENVSLTLEGSPSGAYDATYGTITGTENPFTLAMVSHDTEISALTCPAPTGLEETEITAYSATLNWNGISNNYNVRFYEAIFFDSFEENLSQWTIYKNGDEDTWEWGIENPHDNSSDLSAHTGDYAVVAYGMDSIQADNWLISPQIEFPTQTTLKFWIMRSSYDEFKDEYEVLLSTTGNAIEDFTTTLKEKEVANSNWTEVVIDLSEYDGETGYVAIRHNHYHGFFIMVDDFGIYGWSDLIPVDGNSYTLEGLQPDTYYHWQVQADCGDEDGVSFWSEANTFKTLETCPAPFNMSASDETAYGATINWTGYSESYEVMVGELETTTNLYDFEGDTIISADFTNTSAYPWTVVSGGQNGSYCIKSGNTGVASSTSSISLIMTSSNEGTIEFDAECMGEGTSSLWDHCDFYIDNVRKLYAGENTSGWNHYSFAVAAGEHTFTWSYTKDGSVNPTGDYFAVDNIVIESSNITSWISYDVSEPPFILMDAEHIQLSTSYVVKVIGFCEDEVSKVSDSIIFTTLANEVKMFVHEGDWSDSDNWVPAGVPTIDEDVFIRADVTVFDVAEANTITIQGTATLTIEDGGQLKTNADVTATMKRFIIGYGTDYVETDQGYYLMALPTAAPISAADAGLITEESDYDLYGWDRTATDEEWQNNHDGIDLENGVGYLYSNRDDMEMSFTATLRNSSEPITLTAEYDDVEHGGWNLFGNPFPCEAYITTDAEGMTFYRLVDNELVPVEGAIAPMEAFFVKATAVGQTFTISREAPE